MPVGDLGPDDVVTTSPDATVGAVVDELESENVGAAVVTEEDEPVGVVTDRDVALAVNDADDVAAEPVETVMTADPATIREDREAIEISRVVEEEGVRRVPVVDEGGNLTGIVTVDDLVATIGEQLDHVSETIEVQSPEYSP